MDQREALIDRLAERMANAAGVNVNDRMKEVLMEEGVAEAFVSAERLRTRLGHGRRASAKYRQRRKNS